MAAAAADELLADGLAVFSARRSADRKATLRTHAGTGEVFKPLETASLRTIAAFANSRAGGTLLIGVDDDGVVTGLAGDYASLAKPGKDPRDLFQLHPGNITIAAMGEATAADVSVQIHTVGGEDLARVHVPPSGFPVDAVVSIDRKGQMEKKQAFYFRVSNSTREITAADERHKYVAARWGSAAPPDELSVGSVPPGSE